MAFQEFYCDASAGANINAGDLTANGVVTSTNGAWSTVTNIFTATSGTPFSGVSVGDYATLYADGATVAECVARVTAIGGGGLTLTLSTAARAGTAPVTSATAISCTTGGAWKGPNAASGFPFSLTALDSLLKVTTNVNPRINMKNGTNYAITATVTTTARTNLGYVIEGYTTTVGDGGRFTIDGGTAGASFDLFSFATSLSQMRHGILQNNGATGSANGLAIANFSITLFDIVVNSVRGIGIYVNNNFLVAIQCETYSCNQSNTANMGGFIITASGELVAHYCISHDNTGSNNVGFGSNGGASGAVAYHHCIADSNGKYGFDARTSGNGTSASVVQCDAYNNGSDGVFGANQANVFSVINSNFANNGGYGINVVSTINSGILLNNGFGSGTAANTSGQTNLPAANNLIDSGAVTYAANALPWVDAPNGDFRITLAAAKGAGIGTFTQTAASYTGAIAYPDIGAAQHQDAAAGGGGPVFNRGRPFG